MNNFNLILKISQEDKYKKIIKKIKEMIDNNYSEYSIKKERFNLYYELMSDKRIIRLMLKNQMSNFVEINNFMEYDSNFVRSD